MSLDDDDEEEEEEDADDEEDDEEDEEEEGELDKRSITSGESDGSSLIRRRDVGACSHPRVFPMAMTSSSSSSSSSQVLSPTGRTLVSSDESKSISMALSGLSPRPRIIVLGTFTALVCQYSH
jgi:hypothetical protein